MRTHFASSLQLFDESSLTDEGYLATALAEIACHITRDEPSRVDALRSLLCKPHALEFTLSALPQDAYTTLREHLIGSFFSFPASAQDPYSPTLPMAPRTPYPTRTSRFPLTAQTLQISASSSSSLSDALSLAWLTLDCLATAAYFSSSTPADIERKKLVNSAPIVLTALDSAFPPAFPTDEVEIDQIQDGSLFGHGKKQTQRQRKLAQKRSGDLFSLVSNGTMRPKSRSNIGSGSGSLVHGQSLLSPAAHFEETALHALDEHEAPKNAQEANEMRMRIIEKCRQALEALLDFVRQEDMRDAFRMAYIPVPRAAGPVSAPTTTGASNILNHADSSDEAVGFEDSPATYPAIMPPRAALHFDSADGFGPWRVLIAGRAHGELREARRKDQVKFEIYVKKIKELSHGFFSEDNQKRLTGSGTPIPIFEAKMSRDSRLVYQIDCVHEYEAKVERQVIRVFGFYSHAQIDGRLWNSLGVQLASRRGRQYERRCAFRARPVTTGDRNVPPMEWPFEINDLEREEQESETTVVREKDTVTSDGIEREKMLEEMHTLLVLDKFVAMSQPLMDSIMHDQDFHGLIPLSPYEQEIVHHEGSCYVLGRSGTGKTTTMLIKMLGIEIAWQQTAADGTPRPRQLFVTQSRVLADKVEAAFVRMLESARGTASIEEIAARKKRIEETGLVDRDESGAERKDLPRCFSELQDSHFPMFITFDRLSSLLEADMNNSQAGNPAEDSSHTVMKPINGSSVSGDYIPQYRKALVSYDVFRNDYWIHFPQPLTKGLDPALVFSEFMGVIKGSEQTVLRAEVDDDDERHKHFLSNQAYVALSARGQATFVGKRCEIYSLFEAYIRLKRQRNEFDAADRTHAILKALLRKGVKGRKVDYLYVDEVQDNLLIDAMLLRMISLNPEGLFWAGDTAQTISVGSSFRFNDLKAFLHNIEDNQLVQADLGHKTAREPRSFQLSTNFRSHGGIVSAAGSVIRLINCFWPYAIDILAEERAKVGGIKPVFFTGEDSSEDSENFLYFLVGGAGVHIEFGAKQCILVRNDAARDRLRAQVGDIGVILTLYESKGLEFNDVLLLHFFEDSAVDVSQWRVVLNALEKAQRDCIAAPAFEETRHAGVCAELKFLYVAITRARKNLWIFDASERGVPMRMYWKSQGLVEHTTRSPGAKFRRLAAESTPEEWAVTARMLFDNKRWQQAMSAYERAKMPRERAVAEAYLLREKARSILIAKAAAKIISESRKTAFLAAADAFVACAQEAKLERTEYYRIAAGLYLAVEAYGQAGDAYTLAREFESAAKTYRAGGLFDKTVNILTSHKQVVPQETADALLMVCKLYYFKQHDLKRAAVLFDDVEDALEFAEEYDFDLARADILFNQGRLKDAADLHAREGRIMQAIGLYLQEAESSPESLGKAKDGILQLLWQSFSLGIVPDPSDAPNYGSNRKIFALVQQLLDLKSMQHGDRIGQLTLEAFTAIWKNDVAALREIGMTVLDDHKPLAVLCLDHVFRSSHKLFDDTGKELVETLKCYYHYARLMHDLIFLGLPWQSPNIRRLLNISLTDEGSISVAEETLLSQNYARFSRFDTTSTTLILERPSFIRLYQHALAERLRLSIESVYARCSELPVLDPCPNAVIGYCDPSDQCQREHLLDQAWFNLSLRFYLLQGLILSIHRAIIKVLTFSVPEISKYLLGTWFQRVEGILYPIHYAFGNTHTVKPELVPELERGLQLIKELTRTSLYDLKPHGSPTVTKRDFPNAILRLMNFGFSFDRAGISSYLQHTSITSSKPSYLMRLSKSNQHDRYVIYDLIDFFRGNGRFSLESGIAFLRHIIETELAIEIGSLCSLSDRICSSIIFARRLQMKYPTFHGITLPRSWIIARLENMDTLQGKSARLDFTFVQALCRVIEMLHVNRDTASQFTYQGKPVVDAPISARVISIERLCRCVCLCNYYVDAFNTEHASLRKFIFTAITSLKSQASAHNHYAHYVNAQDWIRMGRVATSARAASALDEMIQLAESGNRIQLGPISRVRRIHYKTLEDICSVLRVEVKKLRAEAAVFIPAAARAEAEAKANAPGKTEDEAEMTRSLETEQAAEALIMQSVADNDSSPPQEVSPESKQQRDKAARIILAFFRSRMSKLGKKSSWEGVAAVREGYFNTCLAQVMSAERPISTLYKRIFLGALPHALTSVDELQKSANAEKKKLKILMLKAEHQALETVMRSQTDIRVYIKELTALKRDLDPAALFKKTFGIKIPDSASSFDDHERLQLVREPISRLHGLAQSHGQVERLGWDLEASRRALGGSENHHDLVSRKHARPALNTTDL